ncbi:MAG: phosphoglycerate dehydrogenase [bacterium]|nr:phosphoglycerate dehydrogenase [bacterium]
MARILVSDPVAEAGIEVLRQAGEVDVRTGLPREELVRIIGEYDALVVRSETKVTAEVIEAARRLRIIGRAGVGVDNIDVAAATQRGIIVVNSPEGNTIAAAEHTIALMMAMARNIPQADRSLRAGEWKRSKFVGTEVYRKTLGIIGLGKIGREVARRAKGLGMNVVAYDPFTPTEVAERIGVKLTDLNSLLAQSDFVTIHTPLNEQTRHLINAERIALMKDGARLINCARGGIVDEGALAEALRSGKLAGAAVDVFSKEPPPPDNPLIALENCVVTPHLGASTEEAQVNVAVDVAEQIVSVLRGGPARSAVNLPPIDPEMLQRIAPYLLLAEKIGKLHTQLARAPIVQVQVTYSPEFADLPTDILTRAVVTGLLQPVLSEPVNPVNALLIAQSRGIHVTQSLQQRPEPHELYPSAITVRAHASDGEKHEVTGTVFGKNDARIVTVDGFRVDVIPQGIMLFTQHTDKPGIIGRVGTLLGSRNVNIAGMHLGREKVGGRALMVLMVDDPIDASLLAEIRALDGMETAQLVEL